MDGKMSRELKWKVLNYRVLPDSNDFSVLFNSTLFVCHTLRLCFFQLRPDGTMLVGRPGTTTIVCPSVRDARRDLV